MAFNVGDWGVLNLLDGDSNANGVLDEDEVVALDRRLGQSSLLGVARRIIDAQERGDNIRSANKGVQRLGKFAMLSGTKTDACQHLLSGGSPLGPELATYYPVCVRDSEFSPLLQQPSGRCALLPNMLVGSQCFVPGDGVGVSQSHAPATSNTSRTSNTSNKSEITPFVPSPQAVCGLLSRLFSKNQGVGGHRSAAGVSSAKWTDPGAELVVEIDPWDKAADPKRTGAGHHTPAHGDEQVWIWGAAKKATKAPKGEHLKFEVYTTTQLVVRALMLEQRGWLSGSEPLCRCVGEVKFLPVVGLHGAEAAPRRRCNLSACRQGPRVLPAQRQYRGQGLQGR